MDINIIKVGLDYGAGTRGTNKAPSYIISGGLIDRLTNLGHSCIVTECDIEPHDDNLLGEYPQAKYLHPIKLTCERLASLVDISYTNGKFPLILGGDHSILLGSLAGISSAASKKNETVGVIYIDAHGDFNTTDTTPTGNIHGECLSASCGYGLNELVNLYKPYKKINSKNVCIIGARDLDEGEKILLKEAGVTVYTAVDIEKYGLSCIVKQAIENLSQKVNKIHLSFDVDSVDPIYSPGTGIHLPGGLTYREAITLAEIIGETKLLCSVDIVEFNPLRDVDGKTCKVCVDFVAHLFGEKYGY